jgi:hypothetical protein
MMAVPASPMMAMELKALADLDTDLASKDIKRARKRATYQNYQARRGEGFHHECINFCQHRGRAVDRARRIPRHPVFASS